MQKDPFLVLQCSDVLNDDLKKISLEADPVFVSGQEDALRALDAQKSIRTIVIGALCPNPIQTAQKFHSYDKGLAFIFLGDEEHFDGLQRSVSFSPFLGQSVHCLRLSEIAEITKLVVKLHAKAKKRQDFKKIFSKANAQLEGMTSLQITDHTSTQYLERLFEVAPIGIVTVSPQGHILTINRFFNDMIGSSEARLLGHEIQNYFSALELKDGRMKNISREGCVYDVTVTSVRGQNREEGYLILFVDVTERKNNEEALERAIVARDEFISIASHELRTPMTSLKMQLQLGQRGIAKNENTTPEKLNKIFNVSLKQVDRLNILIGDLLDVTRIQTGQLNYSFEVANLREIIDGLMERYEPELQIRIKGSEILTVECDVFRIEQVFSNLLSNAVKYGNAKPIEICLEEDETEARVYFKDFGLGIEAEKLELIFNKFARAISSSNISGLGLGLYISKSIVDAHGGSIKVKSVYGEGTEFIIHLPKASATALSPH